MAGGNQANFQLARLANEVERLSGQVATLIAFVEATGSPIPDFDVTRVQDYAQKMAQNGMETDPNRAPALYAERTPELLQEATKMRRPC